MLGRLSCELTITKLHIFIEWSELCDASTVCLSVFAHSVCPNDYIWESSCTFDGDARDIWLSGIDSAIYDLRVVWSCGFVFSEYRLHKDNAPKRSPLETFKVANGIECLIYTIALLEWDGISSRRGRYRAWPCLGVWGIPLREYRGDHTFYCLARVGHIVHDGFSLQECFFTSQDQRYFGLIDWDRVYVSPKKWYIRKSWHFAKFHGRVLSQSSVVNWEFYLGSGKILYVFLDFQRIYLFTLQIGGRGEGIRVSFEDYHMISCLFSG